MAIHSKEIIDSTVVNTVLNTRKIGEEQLNTFIKERLVKRNKPITKTLKKNNHPTFNVHSKKVVSKEKRKSDCCTRTLPFKFENQPWPPALSSSAECRKQILSNACQVVIVQQLKPGTAQAFEHYFYVFATYKARQLETVQKVDVVWNI